MAAVQFLSLRYSFFTVSCRVASSASQKFVAFVLLCSDVWLCCHCRLLLLS